jgi:Fungal specific transcription factor domain
MALGMNMRSTDSELHHTSREARSRLWWSIYMLENLLSHMTGRPTCIGSGAFSVEQPVPFTEDMFEQPKVVELLENEPLRRRCLTWSLDEDSKDNVKFSWLNKIEPNQGLQFYYLVDLMHIVHIAIGELFSPTGFQASRSYIKRRIRFYDEKLDLWLSRLHPAFRFIDEHSNLALQNASRQQIVLALHHYSARIALYRPCSPFRRYASSKEKEYHYISQRCLHSSLSLISIFPDTIGLDWVYNLSPWWCTLHFLMQASTILIIYCQRDDNSEVSNHFEVGDEKTSQIVNACRKAHSWLHALSEVDESCRRAFLLYDGLTQRTGLVVNTPSISTPRHQYRRDMSMPNTEFNQQPHMQDQPQHHAALASDTSTVRRNFSIPRELQPYDLVSSVDFGSFDTHGPIHLIELEGMRDNLTGINRDLMTDNYTQWIMAALEDPDSYMNLP